MATSHIFLIAKYHRKSAKFDDLSCNSLRNYFKKCKKLMFYTTFEPSEIVPSISGLGIQICLAASLGRKKKKLSGLKLWKKNLYLNDRQRLFLKISWHTYKWHRKKIKISTVKLNIINIYRTTISCIVTCNLKRKNDTTKLFLYFFFVCLFCLTL